MYITLARMNTSGEIQLFQFQHPYKERLEDLQMIRADLGRAVECLRVLSGPPPLHTHAPVFAAALQTQALVSYVRCFSTGRRTALNRDIFAANTKFAKDHEEFKKVRDQHVAHPAGPHEHSELIVAAESPESPAIGIGSYNFFFAGFAPKDLRRFLSLVRFVARHAEAEEKRLGDDMARNIIGPKATYAKARGVFHHVVDSEQLYPTKRRAR